MSDIESWACHYVGRIDPSFAQLSLDSMGLMNLLLEAETEYGFSFTPEAFQDRRLQTIFGLAAVIRELKGAV
jgi:acyl carrier protein